MTRAVARLVLEKAVIGTPVELDPFSEANYVTFPSKG